MPNTKKYFTTNIIYISDGWDYSDTKAIACKNMTKQEITQYMNKIAFYNKIPENSCLYYINLDFQETFQRKMFFTSVSQTTHKPAESDGAFHISFKLKNGCKCDMTNCLRNLESGKCKDNFVREIIGKNLIKEKYQENQK